MKRNKQSKPYIDSETHDISIDETISEKDILKKILKEKFKLTDNELAEAIKNEREISLPISVFKNKLSTLEIIVKYLKEEKKLSFVNISELLNRDERTIWHAYKRSLKKGNKLKIIDSRIKIPISVFSDRNLSSLESLVEYLRDQGLTLTKIASKISLNPKTIWTVNNRAKIKRRSNGAK